MRIILNVTILLFFNGYIFAQNVGVDVASPVEKLDVLGAIRIGNTSNSNTGTIRWNGTDFQGYNGSTWLSLSSPAGITNLNGLTGATQTFTVGSAGTTPTFSSSGTVHTLNIPMSATAGVTAGLLSNTQYTTLLNGILPTGLTGQTVRHNGTSWVANSVIYNDGTNVGIGLTPSVAKLEVSGQIRITGGTPAANQVLTAVDNTGIATWEPAQGDNLGNHTATQNIQLNNNWLSNDGGNEGIRVDNSGNVGIGLVPGSVYLDITGTNAGTTSLQLRSGNIQNANTSNQIVMSYDNTENFRHAIKTRHSSGGPGGNAIDFYVWKHGTDPNGTIGTQHVLTIDGGNAGSVGIGTTGPGAQLHTTGSVRFAGLSGASQTTAVMADGSGNLSTRALNAVAFTGDLPTGDTDYIQNSTVGNNFATGQAANFDITGNAEVGGTLNVSGNIGIGTTSTATGKLVVQQAADNNTLLSLQTGANGRLTIGTDASANALIRSQNNVDLRLGVGADNVIIKNGGNVGIGTSPSTKLDVNGTVTATALAGAFDQSASGYVRIGNLQIAWGNVTLASGQSWTNAGDLSYVLATQNITFPANFLSAPTVTFSMIDGLISARSAYVSYHIPSTTGVSSIYLSSPDPDHVETSAVIVHWTAIGRWQ